MKIPGILRKISYHIAIDLRIAGSMREPGWSAARSLSQKKFADPAAMVMALRQNRNIPSGAYPTLARTSIGEVIAALVYEKTLFWNSQRLQSLKYHGADQEVECLGNSFEAEARAKWLKSPTLQNIPEAVLHDPVKLVAWLDENCGRISNELERSAPYSYVYLLQVLTANGLLAQSLNTYLLVDGLRLFNCSPALQGFALKRPETENFKEILRYYSGVVNWLASHRETVLDECLASHLALGTMLMALYAGQKIKLDKRLQFIVGARDYYDQNPVLQEGPKMFGNKREIICFIDARRERLFPKEKTKGRISYDYAVEALFAAGRISPEVSLFALKNEASAADYARKNEAAMRALFSQPNSPKKIDTTSFVNAKGQPYNERFRRTILSWARLFYEAKQSLSAS